MTDKLVMLLAFLAAVWVLVTVHEFGHFWVARKLGFRVLRFSVGFGRPIWRRVSPVDQTEYVLAAVPLGGYVKMLDEREGPVPADELHRSFTRRPHWQRIAVLLAGPAANFLFAILVLAALFWANGATELRPVVGLVSPESLAGRAGLRVGDEFLSINGKSVTGQSDVVFGLLDGITGEDPVTLRVRDRNLGERSLVIAVSDDAERRRLTDPDQFLPGIGFELIGSSAPAIAYLEPDGPAARGGLRRGDRVLAVAGVPVKDFAGLSAAIAQRPDQAVEFLVQRGDARQRVSVAIGSRVQDGRTVGRIGISNVADPSLRLDGFVRHVELGPVAALRHATLRAWQLTALQARFVWRMLFGQVSIKNLSGPITTAEMAGKSAQAGFDVFVSFLITLSLALGFMNLLPIPLLDGGQVLFQLAEWIKGSPLSERVQVAGQQVGIIMVVMLLGLALFNDIARTFG